MALSHSVSCGRESLLPPTKNNGKVRPFVSVAAMVSQIEHFGGSNSSKKPDTPSDSKTNMAQLKIPIRPLVVQPISETIPLSPSEKEKPTNKAVVEETSSRSPKPNNISLLTHIITTPNFLSPLDKDIPILSDSPQTPSSWKAPISWQYIPENGINDASHYVDDNDNVIVERIYPDSPFRELELVIPDISPILTPISRPISPVSKIGSPSRSMNRQQLNTLTPPISPLIGLGVSTFPTYSLINPSLEISSKSHNDPKGELSNSTLQFIRVTRQNESPVDPFKDVSTSSDLISSTPIHTPTSHERPASPGSIFIQSLENLDYIPTSPHPEQESFPFEYGKLYIYSHFFFRLTLYSGTEIHEACSDLRQQVYSQTSSVYIDYESICANMEDEEWQDDLDFEKYNQKTGHISSFYHNQLAAEYRALAKPTHLSQPTNSSTQSVQGSAESAEEDVNDIRLAPHPLFWNKTAPLKRSNARRPRAAPSKRISAVFVNREHTGRRRSSILMGDRGSRAFNYKISSPIPIDDSYIAPMQVRVMNRSSNTIPHTPTLLIPSSPALSYSGTHTTVNCDSPLTPTSNQSSPISPFYPFSPLPPMIAPNMRSATSLSTSPSFIKSPPTPEITESSPSSMIYVTDLEHKHQRGRSGTSSSSSGWHRPLTSALKNVRASLMSRSSTPLVRQGSDEWESEEDRDNSNVFARNRGWKWSTEDNLRYDELPISMGAMGSANTQQEETGRWGLKELLAEKRAERSRKRRGEEIKRNIKYVAVVDPAKVKYDVKPDSFWI
jgi:hypothetical protein